MQCNIIQQTISDISKKHKKEPTFVLLRQQPKIFLTSEGNEKGGVAINFKKMKRCFLIEENILREDLSHALLCNVT